MALVVSIAISGCGDEKSRSDDNRSSNNGDSSRGSNTLSKNRSSLPNTPHSYAILNMLTRFTTNKQSPPPISINIIRNTTNDNSQTMESHLVGSYFMRKR